MAYKKAVRLNLRCPKHTHYNPEGGHGAIKGGCCFCEDLWVVYTKVIELEHEILLFNGSTNRFIECANMKKEGKVK